ncbi:MAG: tetratricopeptide repeat protein [Betaproteobacteria bacterium]|nr:tetratricopeptide repeat protein [Betaproteobacteria bacterium]
MAVYDLEEQENIEALKAWWKDYGKLVIAAVVAFVLGVAGVQGWRYYKADQSMKSAVLFDQVEEALRTGDKAKVKELAAKLVADYPSTTYAARGAMLAARTAFEGGEKDKAAESLQWAAANAKDEALKALANLRLSAVLLDLGKYEDALRVVATPPTEAFAALFADARGDVLVAQGKPADAKAAYQMALDKLPKSAPYRNVVEIKRDALGIQ